MFKQKRTDLKNQRRYIDICRLFSFLCPTPTADAVEQVQWAVVRCCRCCKYFFDFFRCLHSFLYGACYFLRIHYFDLRCEHLLVCHPNSSQNESCGWLQLPDWKQFAQNPFKLDFNPKQLVCRYPKPYFRVIPLFPWIMKVYTPWMVETL